MARRKHKLSFKYWYRYSVLFCFFIPLDSRCESPTFMKQISGATSQLYTKSYLYAGTLNNGTLSGGLHNGASHQPTHNPLLDLSPEKKTAKVVTHIWSKTTSRSGEEHSPGSVSPIVAAMPSECSDIADPVTKLLPDTGAASLVWSRVVSVTEETSQRGRAMSESGAVNGFNQDSCPETEKIKKACTTTGTPEIVSELGGSKPPADMSKPVDEATSNCDTLVQENKVPNTKATAESSPGSCRPKKVRGLPSYGNKQHQQRMKKCGNCPGCLTPDCLR
jgi:hypothetical protein